MATRVTFGELKGAELDELFGLMQEGPPYVLVIHCKKETNNLCFPHLDNLECPCK